MNEAEERLNFKDKTIEEIKEENIQLKKVQVMLLNELKNTQRDKYAINKRCLVAEKRYGMISEFLKSVLAKVKVGNNKEAESFYKKMQALQEITAENLRKAGVDRAI